MSATTSTTPVKMTPEEKEAFHREAEARVTTFKYEKPAESDRPKDVEFLTKSPWQKINVQVVRDGGENNLHYHTNSDTTWMVLKGRCRFYGVGDVLIADVGPNEGILLPGGARYWFEKAGPDDLEILQMVAMNRNGEGGAKRINVDAHKDWMDTENLLVYEAPAAR
jgi:mannose-6-phosphate isomerase-like protein (cupin superfamily)